MCQFSAQSDKYYGIGGIVVTPLRARSRAGRTGQSLFFYRSMFHRSRLMHNFDQKRENNRTAGYKNKDHAYSDPLDFWKLLEAQS